MQLSTTRVRDENKYRNMRRPPHIMFRPADGETNSTGLRFLQHATDLPGSDNSAWPAHVPSPAVHPDKSLIGNTNQVVVKRIECRNKPHWILTKLIGQVGRAGVRSVHRERYPK